MCLCAGYVYHGVFDVLYNTEIVVLDISSSIVSHCVIAGDYRESENS